MLIGLGVLGYNYSQGRGAFAYGLEFEGGTSTTVDFDKDYTINEIDQEIVPVVEEVTGDNNVQTQKVEGSNQSSSRRLLWILTSVRRSIRLW